MDVSIWRFRTARRQAITWITTLLALATAYIVLTSCARPHPTPPITRLTSPAIRLTPPVTRPLAFVNIVGVDISPSTTAIRAMQVNELIFVYRKAFEKKQPLIIYTLDNDIKIIYELQVPSAPEPSGELLDYLKPGISTAQGTRPVKLWRDIYDRFGDYTEPMRVVFLTDGGSDILTDIPEIRRLTSRLAQKQNLQDVLLLGVRPDLDTDSWNQLKAFKQKGILGVRISGQSEVLERWMDRKPKSSAQTKQQANVGGNTNDRDR